MKDPVFIATLLLLIAGTIALKFRLPQYARYSLLAVSLGYLGFYYKGCICPIGAFQNIFLIFKNNIWLQCISWLTLILLPVIFVFIAGRVYCGSVCPMGAVQEIVFKLGQKLRLNKGKPGLERYSWLKYIKYVVMSSIIVYTAITGIGIFCSIEPFIYLFTFTGTTTALVLLIIILGLSLFISRPWCRYICPYGALLGIFTKISYSIRRLLGLKPATPVINETSCKKCGICNKSCPVNAIENFEIDETECINCGKCSKSCKLKAIK